MRKRRGRRKSYSTGVAGPIVSLFFILPLLSMLNHSKPKRKRKKTLDEQIDDHFK